MAGREWGMREFHMAGSSQSSLLRSFAPYPEADGRSGVCHITCLKPISSPTPALIARAKVVGNAPGARAIGDRIIVRTTIG
jgi:hypothetical protein